MEQFKIKHPKHPGKDSFKVSSIKETIIDINDNLTQSTIEEIHEILFRAHEICLDKEIVAIAMSEACYCSIVKVAGLEPEYMGIPVIIQPVPEPVIKFKAKINILYPNEVRYVNTGKK